MKRRTTVITIAIAMAAAMALPSVPSAQSTRPAPSAQAQSSPPADAESGYLMPPKAIVDVMDAEPLPGVQLSRDRSTMLLSYRRSMPSIAEVTAPWIGLAGSRINPRTNGPHVVNGTTSLVLKEVASGTERKLALPEDGFFSGSFSPDGKKLAITHTTGEAIRLLIADVATGRISTILDGGVNGLTGGCTWLENSTGFFCRMIPEGRGPVPEKPRVPAGPNIQQSLGRVAPGRTYQDLLTSPHDERLFDHYYATQMAWVALDGAMTSIGAPGVYHNASRSRDDQHMVVTRLKRPYSYLVPASQFPRDVELWDRTGKRLRTLADVPMGDTVPANGVFAGPRSFMWHPLKPTTLFWTEALDRGDPKVKVPHRDRIVMLSAPFTGEPTEAFKTEWRYSGMSFTENGAALASEFNRPSRMRRTWIFDDGFASRSAQDLGAPRRGPLRQSRGARVRAGRQHHHAGWR